MGSPPRTPREEEQRLNMRTLVIASAASATAALVTSRLWIAGTWIAAATTPLIVALVSELLHKPTERIARAITADRPALQLDESEEAPAPRARPDPDAPAPAPVRVYRQPPTQGTPRRRLALGVVIATAGIGLLVGAVALTTAELLAGQSIGKGDSATSLVGGKARHKRSSGNEQTTPATVEETAPARTTPTTPEEQPTVTVTVPAETTPRTTTTPPATQTAP